MSEQEEFVEVKVKVPKQIVEFLKAFNVDVKKYCEERVVRHFSADLDAGEDVFSGDVLELIHRFKLAEIPQIAEDFHYLLK